MVWERCKSGLRKVLLDPLPGTGVPPDLEFVSDGATVGKFYSRARATLSLSGVLRSVPFPPYTASVFVGAANERADARGPAVIQGWEETFRALGFGGFGKVVREQVKI